MSDEIKLFTSATPAAAETLGTFELPQNYGFSMDTTKVVVFNSANHTSGGKKVFRINQSNPVGPAKSLKVYPGDSVKVEVWAYYEATSGYSTNNVGLVTAIAAAFGGVSAAGGESGMIYDGVNSALGGFAAGGSPDDDEPPAYLNYILFDQQYKVLDAGWTRVPTSANFAKQKVTLPARYITEAGYYFTYLSYEGQSSNFVYFDDYKVRHVKSRLIQANEYYPFGMQTANSWTRESGTGNNYLANGGTEVNQTSQFYDLFFRNYDPALGRMFQVDPLASKYPSLTPYNYVANNPIRSTDPYGDDMVIMNGRLANPHNPLTGEEMWDPMDRYVFGMALAGGGDPGGISINGRALSSFSQDVSGRYGTWVTFSYMDYSSENYDPKTGGRLATIVIGERFVPLSEKFGIQEKPSKPPESNGRYNDYDALSFGLTLTELYRQGKGAVQFGMRLDKAEKILADAKYFKSMSASRQAFNTAVSGFKVVGKGVAVLSIGVSITQYVASDRSGADKAKLVGAAIITATVFIPVAGPFISIGLGLLDAAGAFEGFYEDFDN